MRLLAALVILGVLLLTTTASAQVINGCVKDSNGLLRIVADPAECTVRETPISWNQAGPQGEPGADATELHVFDRNGVDVGIFLNGQGVTPYAVEDYVLQIYLPEHGITYEVSAGGGGPVDSSFMYYFAEPGCQGTAYTYYAGRLVAKWETSPPSYIVTGNEVTEVTIVSRSSLPSPPAGYYCAEMTPRSRFLVTARFVDPASEYGLTFPLPAPLVVAPAPGPAP